MFVGVLLCNFCFNNSTRIVLVPPPLLLLLLLCRLAAMAA
jgi:hypothetical protein